MFYAYENKVNLNLKADSNLNIMLHTKEMYCFNLVRESKTKRSSEKNQ